MKRKLLYTAALLGLCVLRANAVYVPLTISAGLNQDVIANGIGGGSTSTTSDVDGANYIYVSNGWQLTSTSTPLTLGLPSNGTINSAVTSGLTYQLAAYTGNNDLRMAITSTTGTDLTFATPYYAAQTVYLLAVSGSGSSTMSAQINFTDGTNQPNTGITVSDWYGGTSVALTGFERMNTTNNILDNAFNGPNLYQIAITVNTANQTKQISSVTIVKTGGTGVLNVFAVSINQSAVTCAAPTAPTATGITTTSAILNWTQTGTPINYQIKYGAPGFNVTTGGTSIFTTTKPYTLNPPLALGTSYDFYVRAICSSTDTSSWSAVTNFTTLCNAPSVVSKKDSFNCGTGVVNLEATTTSGASIKWYAGTSGGTALATGSSFTTPSISTTTNYYITAISGTCESSPRQAVIATIRPIPTVNLGNDTTICPGVSYTFNAGNAGGTYLWSPGGQTTQTINTNAAGQYIVKVTVNKCVNRDTILVTPGINPTDNLPSTVNLCSGDTATLNAGNVGSTYVWTPSGATTQTIKTTTGGNFSVQIRSADGCKITDAANVILRPLPVANLGNDTSICESSSILLDAGNSGYSFLWNTGVTTQTISVTDSGEYKVTVTSPYSCVTADSEHVSFLPSPRTEGFSFVPQFFDELGKVAFTPLNPTNVDSYEWDFGDNSPHVTLMNPVHVYAASGIYTVTLKVYNHCTDFSLSQDINVDLPTGVVTINKKDINLKIYPNPATSVLNISNQSPEYKMEDIMLFNSMGALVYHHKADSQASHQLSVAGFADGVYFVRILTDKGFVNQQVQVAK